MGYFHRRRHRMGHALCHARPRKNPKSSVTFEDDKLKRIEFSVTDASIEEEFTTRQKLVLIDFAGGMALIVWGLVTQGWYMNEISAVFLGMGLLAGILGGLDQQTIADEFVKGLADFATQPSLSVSLAAFWSSPRAA